jgi:hypothetical protein
MGCDKIKSRSRVPIFNLIMYNTSSKELCGRCSTIGQGRYNRERQGTGSGRFKVGVGD